MNPAFLDDGDRKFFLWLLSEMNERFAVQVEAFALMTNHYHLLLAGDLGKLARAMHRLGFLYTQYFNNRHELTGPLFSDRYYSSPVHDDTYHANALRYIHRNPLAIDPLMDLARYEWSSYGTYLGVDRSRWLSTSEGLKLFDCRNSFRDFVEDENNDVWIPVLADLHDVVAAVSHTPMDDVLARRPGAPPTDALLLFCLLAHEFARSSSTEIAAYSGIPSSTIRRLVVRARSVREQIGPLRDLADRAEQKLGPVSELPPWWSGAWAV